MVFFLPSCEEALEENPKGSVAMSTFYKTEEDMQLAVNGIYDDLWTIYFYKDHINVSYNDKPTDIIRGNSRNNNLTGIDVWQWDATTSIFNNHWGAIYHNMLEANFVLEAFTEWRNGEREIDISQSKGDQLEGEARFLRALWYHNLTKMFGGVPIVDKPTRSDDAEHVTKARNTEEECWTFVENDLTTAIDLMDPYEASNQQNNRATVASAQALLARVHALQKEWGDAKKYAQDALSHGYVDLMPDYSLIWHPDHEGGPEHIFSSNKVQGGSTTSKSNNNVWWYSVKGFAWEQPGGDIITIDFATNEDLKGHNQWVSDEMFYATPNSYRKWHTMRDRMPYYIIKETNERVNDTVVFPDNVSPMFVKHHVLQGDMKSQYTEVNETIIRASEMYLIIAEAENELNGPTQVACDAINAVRARARGDNVEGLGTGKYGGRTPESVLPDINPGDVASKGEFRDSVITEFARELICEGLFRGVLRRHDMYAKNSSKWVDSEAPVSGQWAEHKEIYPIPKHQIELNPNLVQNPGYRTGD